jgi:hypothetical protein
MSCKCREEEIDTSKADERLFERNIIELSPERKREYE